MGTGHDVTYLVRAPAARRGRDVRVADELRVRWGRKTKEVSVRDSPIGRIRQVTDAGVDHRTLVVLGRTRDGREGTRAWGPATAAGLKRIVRHLRPAEAARLADLDAGIAAMEAQLREARETRQALLQEAFTKGHVVTLAEAKALVDTRKETR